MKIMFAGENRHPHGAMPIIDATPGEFAIDWHDSGRTPQCEPNPDFLSGMDTDVSDGQPACWGAVPYPAPRCGAYIVRCLRCGFSAAFTTAGRPDDLVRFKLPCQAAGPKQ